MKQSELLKMLNFFENLGMWAFKLYHIKMFFINENEKCLQVALNRHCKNGIIAQCSKGVYMNPRTKKPPFYLEALAGILRDNATFYLSLESRLSEEGLISQIPNRLTFISQGRSQIFKTPCGLIEFVHSQKKAKDFLKSCFFDKDRKIYIASQEQAIKDIYKHNRSVDLYEEEMRKEANGFA